MLRKKVRELDGVRHLPRRFRREGVLQTIGGRDTEEREN